MDQDPAPTAASPRLVVNTTDLYLPSQDCGDNWDIVTPYCLDEVRQLLVILDGNHHLRDPEAQKAGPVCIDGRGIARDPGFAALAQLDHLCARRTPWCLGPWTSMRSPDDDLGWIPANEQVGIAAFCDTLRAAPAPVDLTVFGSSRLIAAALNREPALLRRCVRMVHFNAGTAAPAGDDFQEWNIGLDPCAAHRLLASDLPVTIYPCATAAGPFALGRHNTFWRLPDLGFLARMHPRLRSYLVFHFAASRRPDVLRAVEQDPDPAELARVMAMGHNVWETAVWLAVSGRRLVRRADGSHRILRPAGLAAGDQDLTGRALPCRIRLRDGRGRSRPWMDKPPGGTDHGLFDWEPAAEPTGRWMYDRVDAGRDQLALREALPELYVSYRP